ncbi:hypothetical protein [uncultured Shewanella sp.]|uniref:DUF6942 family protein n=1 Tax=uncultured Shewanella sp. TaxID=173975 RepID=UPI00260CED30|nr:hypothetical protein [uncultured Shewanella sp.]
MNKTPSVLGSHESQYTFYLPNAPILPKNWHHTQADAIPSLISLNGNHWRKIVTIMAKIMCPLEDWKTYRDNDLLKKAESIYIGAKTLSPQAQVHIISGQTAAERLALDVKKFQSINEKSVLKTFQSHLIVPYLDYRQYPNTLIAVTRDYLTTL